MWDLNWVRKETKISEPRDLNLATTETKILVSYIEERYKNEPAEVQDIRSSFAIIIDKLVNVRNKLERWEKSRNLQIAITHLEDGCMRAVKAAYMME